MGDGSEADSERDSVSPQRLPDEVGQLYGEGQLEIDCINQLGIKTHYQSSYFHHIIDIIYCRACTAEEIKRVPQ